MKIVARGSKVHKPRTDSSELIRSFGHGVVYTTIPRSRINHSLDLADYFGASGINLDILEVDGIKHTSRWYLLDAMASADGSVSEFLVCQNASEQFGQNGETWEVKGQYFLRFSLNPIGDAWYANRQCVYLWTGSDESTLEYNHVHMIRQLEIGLYSRYFTQLLYRFTNEE